MMDTSRRRIFWSKFVILQWMLVLALVLVSVQVAESFGTAARYSVLRQQLQQSRRTTTSQLWDSEPPTPPPNKRKLTPAQRAIQKTIREESNLSGFDQVKKGVYGGLDSIKGLSSAAKKAGSSSDSEPAEAAPTMVIRESYAEVEKRALESGGGKAPAAPFFAVPGASFAAKKKKKKKQEPTTPTIVPPPKNGNEPRPSFSVFDSLKAAAFDTVDKASKLAASSKSDSSSSLQLKTEQPAAVDDVKNTKIMQEMFPDLNSDNVFKKAAAQVQYQIYLQQERARKANLARQKAVEDLKQTAYKVGDTIQETAETIQALPGRVQQSVETTVEVAQKTAKDIQAIPSKVEQTVKEVEESVNTGIDRSKQFVEDVKALPDKARQTAEETKEGFEAAKDTLEEVSTNTKVFLGLEKPKPRPPKSKPPTPPNPTDQLLNAVGTVAFGAGKFALWAGKGLAGAGVNYLKDAAEASKAEKAAKRKAKAEATTTTVSRPAAAATTTSPATPVPPQQQPAAKAVLPKQQQQKQKQPPPPPKQAPKASAPAPPVTTKKEAVETELDAQVQEALRLAAEAMDVVEGRKGPDTKNE